MAERLQHEATGPAHPGERPPRPLLLPAPERPDAVSGAAPTAPPLGSRAAQHPHSPGRTGNASPAAHFSYSTTAPLATAFPRRAAPPRSATMTAPARERGARRTNRSTSRGGGGAAPAGASTTTTLPLHRWERGGARRGGYINPRSDTYCRPDWEAASVSSPLPFPPTLSRLPASASQRGKAAYLFLFVAARPMAGAQRPTCTHLRVILLQSRPIGGWSTGELS